MGQRAVPSPIVPIVSSRKYSLVRLKDHSSAPTCDMTAGSAGGVKEAPRRRRGCLDAAEHPARLERWAVKAIEQLYQEILRGTSNSYFAVISYMHNR